ncbi:16S rRNA (uracil(1498)-N(3))-methyltransferase [Alphaproteobacteria bacterium]|nr:16S rRNA (uracil(1498)-N(3))-methyltransferase [Alphaproteobacteria bacterium]
MRIIRLFVDHNLTKGTMFNLNRLQAHYLLNVMRRGTADTVHLFNGREGEWRCVINVTGRAQASVTPREQVRDQIAGPDLWLAFAPVKRARIDLIAEKATELGASAIIPVMTENTSVSRVNTDRLCANATEAAEQCGRLTLPDVRQQVDLTELLAGWPAGRRLIVCDETGGGEPVINVLQRKFTNSDTSGWGILTGPEGGFSRSELDLLAENPIVTRVGLGPRILRADTAAIAALVCWQAVLGDWAD